jgi:hypothetical protein
MNSEKVNDWLQLVGMAAVVASLLFVGLQLQQSQEIAIAAQYQARADAVTANVGDVLQSAPGMRVVGRNTLEVILSSNDIPANLKAMASEQPVEELAFRGLTAYRSLKGRDNLYFQYQSGFLSEEAWYALRVEFRRELHNPRLWTRNYYERDPEIWRKSFQSLINELLDEGKPTVE